MTTTVQDRTAAILDTFRQQFNLRESSLNGKNADQDLIALRKKALDKALASPLPSRKSEDWKYTPISRFLQAPYEVPSMPVVEGSLQTSLSTLPGIHLYVVDGISMAREMPSLKDDILMLPFHEALQHDFIRPKALPLLEETVDKGATFDLLNLAMAHDGFVLYVPKNKVLNQRIFIHHMSSGTAKANTLRLPQLLVIMEQGSQAVIIENFEDEPTGVAHYSMAAHHFSVEANARLTYYKVQNLDSAAFQVHQVNVAQHRDSVFSAYSFDMGGAMVRNNLHIGLKDSNTETHMYGTYFGQGKQHIDNQTFIDHAFPHCESNEMYKGIVTDRARGVFNGKVIVRQDAQKTNAFQQNSNLVLSPNAVIDAKPQLEIFADDVKCSHGATIGQLDEEAVYYLMTRGLSDKDARQLLQFAFLSEVVQEVPDEDLRKKIEQAISKKFNKIS